MEKKHIDFLRGTRISIGFLCAVLLVTLLLGSCQGGTMTGSAVSLRTLESVSSEKLEKLLNRRLFFGHQSVGFNIIQGISEVLREKGKRGFTFKESRTFSDSPGPGFFHFAIGQNTDPLGKMRDFEQIIRKNAGNPVDIAFMKLCYVDIYANTNVEPLFTSYRDTMAQLRLEFPRTQFVHMTVPLVARPNDPKSMLKKILGRTVAGYEDNLAREGLNRLLRKEYEDKEPLFDLALFESVRRDGTRVAYQMEGETYYALEKQYTDDGGHLNAQGRKLVAEQLLVFLAEVLH